LTIALVSLIFRAVAIEYRGKGSTERWRRWWDRALGLGSLGSAFGIGAALALTTTGLPINANGDRVGGAFAWFTPYAVLGGLAVVGFSLVHASAFLGLKTDGEVRMRARTFLVRWSPVALLPIVGWVLAVQFQNGTPITWGLVVVAVIAVVFAWMSARAGREGFAFIGIAAFLLAGASSIFAAVYPVVLPSTLDSAFDLTISNAASGEYTLMVMSVVTAFGLPLVFLYQGYTYWVFRKRLSEHHIPEAHIVTPAVASAVLPSSSPR
jgi:cytochrome d ubiquinol oxidase subunit II